jgi:enolase-phosphatase E1
MQSESPAARSSKPTSRPRVILLDIEGTVAPISFVHDVLFPHARAQMESYLRAHWNDAPVAAARVLLNGAGDFSQATLAMLTTQLHQLMDADVKSTPLKQLQGLIWDQGYRAGKYRSPVFPDVAPAMKRWTQSGKTVAIYSSGSIAAQKVFFEHTTDGDLTPYISAYFDTTTGPKRSAASYVAVAGALKTPLDDILFISDIPEELEAAQTAGMRCLLAVRPGNAAVPMGKFERMETFDLE